MTFLEQLFREVTSRAQLLLAMQSNVTTEYRQYLEVTRQELQKIESDAEEYVQAFAISKQQQPAQLRALSREYHRLSRDLGVLEEYLIGHIVHLNDQDRRVTAIANWLWQGLNLPGPPPLVISSTSNYYNTVPRYNIVFTPVSASETLLTIPDAVHEFGHLVHARHARLFGTRFNPAIQTYLFEVETRAAQISRPLPPGLTDRIGWTWREGWGEEIACDTFATLLLGSAYAWCNLSICMKRPEVHTFASHPADSCRTTNIHRILKRNGEAAAADELDRIWNDYCNFMQPLKPPHYDDFHSSEVALSVVDDVCESIRLFRPDSQIVTLVNDLWRRFASGDMSYKAVEAQIYRQATL